MIITLCGSARFENQFHYWNKFLTLEGHVVFSLAAFPSWEGSRRWYTDTEKMILDGTYLLKICLSDAILILNVDGYIGKGCRKEVEHAKALGKSIYTIERSPEFARWGDGQ